ncbi:MAG: prepilin peptidase [Caulobacteraceae bacterium]|nr:prepilin peptidase [Caulobacteraceae bacterium]
MDIVSLLILSLFPALVIVGALSDITTMTIPNWISLALIGLFFPVAFAAHLSVGEVAANVGVGVVALLIGMVMFALRWVGGGDAKMLAAAALWLGLPGVPSYLLWVTVSGGLFAVFLMQARAFGQPYALRAPAWVGKLLQPKGDIPYGVALCAGALAAFPQSALMAGLLGNS